jgi:hypothetical protein
LTSKINWFGLTGGISIIILVFVSLFVPWWQLVIGDNLVTTNVSPLNTNFNFIGDSLTIPLIFALNIISLITLSAGGIVMLIYSVKPLKPYSKKLLSFSYRKPLYSVILFVLGLFLITIIVRSLFNFDVPLIGTQSSTLPADLTEGVTMSVSMTAKFQWPFILAIVSAISCIIARFYHKKIHPISPKSSKISSSGIINPTSPFAVLEENYIENA